jgi:cell division protein FtsL
MRRERSAWPEASVRDPRGRSRVLLRERLDQEQGRPEGRGSGRLGLLYPLVLCALVVAATALIIDNRTRLVGGSYEIDALRRRAAELRTHNRQLRLEISALTGPAELDRIAADLGLRQPRPDQLVSLAPAGAQGGGP